MTFLKTKLIFAFYNITSCVWLIDGYIDSLMLITDMILFPHFEICLVNFRNTMENELEGIDYYFELSTYGKKYFRVFLLLP